MLGERTLLLKVGKGHRDRDPAPIHIRSIVDMTNQYEEESSSRKLRALATKLIDYNTRRHYIRI